jgi:hypothetical protein
LRCGADNIVVYLILRLMLLLFVLFLLLQPCYVTITASCISGTNGLDLHSMRDGAGWASNIALLSQLPPAAASTAAAPPLQQLLLQQPLPLLPPLLLLLPLHLWCRTITVQHFIRL